MKTTWTLTTLCLLIVAVAIPNAQDDAIDRPLLAAPPAMRDGAMVIALAADGSHRVLREGSNGLMCWDRSDEPNREFSVQCSNDGNLARVKQNHTWAMSGRSGDELRALRESAEADGSREVSEFGTVAVPFATAESLGLPDEGSYTQAGTWIMEAGTSSAHIMLPGR